jgi:hypothetical protein
LALGARVCPMDCMPFRISEAVRLGRDACVRPTLPPDAELLPDGPPDSVAVASFSKDEINNFAFILMLLHLENVTVNGVDFLI